MQPGFRSTQRNQSVQAKKSSDLYNREKSRVLDWLTQHDGALLSVKDVTGTCSRFLHPCCTHQVRRAMSVCTFVRSFCCDDVRTASLRIIVRFGSAAQRNLATTRACKLAATLTRRTTTRRPSTGTPSRSGLKTRRKRRGRRSRRSPRRPSWAPSLSRRRTTARSRSLLPRSLTTRSCIFAWTYNLAHIHSLLQCAGSVSVNERWLCSSCSYMLNVPVGECANPLTHVNVEEPRIYYCTTN